MPNDWMNFRLFGFGFAENEDVDVANALPFTMTNEANPQLLTKDSAAIAGINALLSKVGAGYSFRDPANQVQAWPGTDPAWDGSFVDVRYFPQGLPLVVSSIPLDVAQIIWSEDGVNPVSGGLFSTPTNLTHVETGGFHVYFSFVLETRIAPFYRLHVENATPPPVFEVAAFWSGHPFRGSWAGAVDPLNLQSRYLQTRSLTTGIEPDGETLTNTPADGVAYEYEDADGLGPAEVVVGDVFDTRGHRAVKLTVTTDEVSATSGIQLRWFRDAAMTKEILPPTKRTFKQDDADEGGAAYVIIPRARYGRMEYQNGGQQSSAFFAQVTLHAGSLVNPIGEIGGSVSLTSLAVMGISHLMGANDSDVVDIIRRASLGGLRVAINQHEKPTPEAKHDSVEGNATTVGSGGATQIAGSIPADCQAIMVQSDPDNGNVAIYLGTSSGVTVGNAMHSLGTAGSVTIPVGQGQSLWVRASTGSGKTVRWMFLRRASP